MEIIFLISFVLSILYIGTLSRIMVSWDETSIWEEEISSNESAQASILLPFRNEETQIKDCILSIIKSMDYYGQEVELICIDDHSTDQSLSIVNQIEHHGIRVVSNEGQGKKDALKTGIGHASQNIIICTDADSIVLETWVANMISFLTKTKAKMVTGPVCVSETNSFLSKWQYLDIIGMMSITAHGIYRNEYRIANGANMAFTKESFNLVKGFDENRHLASGDDVFLIQSIERKWPNSVRFLKSTKAIVRTAAETSLTDLYHQRKRWAGKTKSYQEKKIIRLQGFAWTYSLIILVSLVLGPLTDGFSFFTGIYLLFVKMTMDYLLLSNLANFFQNREPLKWFLPIGLSHLLYILWAGIQALLPSKYFWKGRKAK